jgi:signal transduction histidine kinase
MSGTRSAPRRPLITAGRLVDGGLALFCAVMLGAMWIFEGEETIPYHFLFLAVAIVYGFRVWPMAPTIMVMALVMAVTGLLFVRAFAAGFITYDEMSEVLLMPLLLLAMVWHARRREAAMRTVQRMVEVNRELLEREHEFLRDTSHAIRTPVTIARGHVDLALSEASDPDLIEDLQVVSRQLDRTEMLSARLLSLAALDSTGLTHFDMLELTDLGRRSGREWAAREDRVWIQDFGSRAWILGDPTSLEAAIDAMVENALHFTEPGDVIRLSCRTEGDTALVEVADSGPGIAEQDQEKVFQRFWHTTPPDGVVGSGLGLSMVWSIAQAHGGHATAGTSPEGGALVTIALPLQRFRTELSSTGPSEVAWLPPGDVTTTRMGAR